MTFLCLQDRQLQSFFRSCVGIPHMFIDHMKPHLSDPGPNSLEAATRKRQRSNSGKLKAVKEPKSKKHKSINTDQHEEQENKSVVKKKKKGETNKDGFKLL